MRANYTDSAEYKTINRIKVISGSIVLRKDLGNLASYRQMSRILKDLIAKKKLVKIGAGIYAKAYTSKYTDIPLIKNGADSAFRSALERLDIVYEPGSAEKEYNEGRSTQVPVQNIVKLKSRCRRRICYRNSELIFERKINAK